ncbi:MULTISPECIES: hypothetical protein [Bacillales]|uniref:hypothetical protein n=1 Tax=Bacillales TaxID=1385 RepID=UPI0006A7C54E|nr:MULTISPECIES: hypothetical protein [Bacillales]OBZ16768.1 hypothetical protein A7975_02340 [Bacillus sp. FJAT-26390]
MGRNKAIGAGVVAVALMMSALGCGSAGDKRTPKEWLSLSYSGLAATDQYDFTGSMSMKTADGLEFKPEVFEGKVVDHQQLTLQTNTADPLHWNPVQVLEALNNANDEVRLLNESNNPDTVTLLITENASVSKERWEQRLRQQLDQLDVPAADRPYHEEWSKELARSRKQLEQMLASMQAVTKYELVIDRDRLLPLKMEEKTSFSYTYNQKPAAEERHTTVRFQSFNGASSETVQQTQKRVTMD